MNSIDKINALHFQPRKLKKALRKSLNGEKLTGKEKSKCVGFIIKASNLVIPEIRKIQLLSQRLIEIVVPDSASFIK